jgi:hypothetical protein
MRTNSGLDVPQGYTATSKTRAETFGGKAPKRAGTTRARSRGRTLPARQITEGTKLRGQRTFDDYEVLHATDGGNGFVTFTVMNCRTTEVRHWKRRSEFRMELA